MATTPGDPAASASPAPIRLVTDGASKGNPGPGGWAALLILPDHVQELGGSEANTTNNRMEMRAALEGLRQVPAGTAVEVITDSTYLVKGMTAWVAGWQRRGWKTQQGEDVLNRDLWEALAAEVQRLSPPGVRWQHVRGHAGHAENERANTIAQAYAARRKPPPPSAAAVPPARPQASSEASDDAAILARIEAARPAAKTYLSLVDGTVQRHTTWEACKARVHGVPKARYKKCQSAAEELATIRQWGLSAPALL